MHPSLIPLDMAAEIADIVAYLFVQKPSDIELLQSAGSPGSSPGIGELDRAVAAGTSILAGRLAERSSSATSTRAWMTTRLLVMAAMMPLAATVAVVRL